MSPFSPAVGILIYASGFIMHFFMLLFMFYMEEYGMCLLNVLLMSGFAGVYNDFVDW